VLSSPFIPTILATILAAATPAAAGARLEIGAVVDRVQRRYDGAADFRARFTQTLTSLATGRKTNSAGAVMFKKPGRMRWDYDEPERATYVSDGGVLWLYEPEDRQAFKQALKASQLPAALAFLAGKGKLAAEFDVTAAPRTPYGGPGDYLLTLAPKVAEPQVKSILFVVDPRTFDVRETVITDGQGNLNDLTFAEIRMGTHIPETEFHFTPPAGVRVIDTGKLGK
jgi:outer membrane lipoprotein carrier protein